ncbi:hypothetical protein PENTCL1PPCAC_5460, partial [Pristionchus entomophagus]
TLRETRLSTVEDLKKKITDFSFKSDDVLVSVISKAFDVSHMIMKGSNDSRIITALKSLASERSLCFQDENFIDPSLRSMTYGFLESFQLTLLHLYEEKNQKKESSEISTQTDEAIRINVMTMTDFADGLVSTGNEEMEKDHSSTDSLENSRTDDITNGGLVSSGKDEIEEEGEKMGVDSTNTDPKKDLRASHIIRVHLKEEVWTCSECEAIFLFETERDHHNKAVHSREDDPLWKGPFNIEKNPDAIINIFFPNYPKYPD